MSRGPRHLRTEHASAGTRGLRVGAIADHAGCRRGPFDVALALESARPASGVLIAQSVRILDIRPAPDAPPPDGVLDRRDRVAVPPFVNAHAHLDLSALGPRPRDPATPFTDWLAMIRRDRPVADADIAASVDLGVRLSRAGGVAAVGDIAGAPRGVPTVAGWHAARRAGLPGVTFIEFFAFGPAQTTGIDAMRRAVDRSRSGFTPAGTFASRLGIQPHAPYSVSIDGYLAAVRIAADLGERVRLATHLAETLDERRFVAAGEGPQRTLLERLGLWPGVDGSGVGRGMHPVEHIAPALAERPGRWLAAHVADAPDAVIERLARLGVSVAYCPRAAADLGVPETLGPHRYREMLAAGVNVCLGTDSIVNLDTPGRISPLDDARLLRRRDRTDPVQLLAMATVHGAAALGLDTSFFALRAGRETAGIVLLPAGEASAEDPLAAAFENGGPPETVVLRAADPSPEAV